MSEESRIKSCSSEIGDNPNLFSITHVEYGLSFEQVQAEMRTPEQWGVFLIDKMKMALGFLIHAQVWIYVSVISPVFLMSWQFQKEAAWYLRE